MDKLEVFIKRMAKLGVNIELMGNYPWIYIDKINGEKVIEQWMGNHGFTIMFQTTNEFTDISEIFNLIRKYVKK